MNQREKKIAEDLTTINRQCRSGAIDAEEAAQDYMFTAHVKYEPIGRPD